MFEYLVIGKGLFGAAAARHLSATSDRVAIIGPDEPAKSAQSAEVYASHYDQGRLQRHMSRDLVWAILSHRAYREYAALHADSGVSFYHPVPSVHIAPRTGDSVFVESAAETARELAIDCTTLHSGAEVAARFPVLRVPDACHGYIEHIPAGYINPRSLIEAQLTVSAQRGATIIRETVRAVTPLADRVQVTTSTGARYEARRALVAAGAYVNDLLPSQRPLALRVKSETILLARVDDTERARLADMPSMIYEVDAAPVETIYMLPPIQYPDGHYYIKMGANTAYDRYLTTREAKNSWVRTGDSDRVKRAMADVMRDIVPGLRAQSFETRRCLVTYTPGVWPFIDSLDGERLYVVTGGNGMGAKSSDAIGKAAADMMIHGRWVDELPHEHFAVRYEDEMAALDFSWGECGMAKRKPRLAPRDADPTVPAASTAPTAPAAPTRPIDPIGPIDPIDPSALRDAYGIQMGALPRGDHELPCGAAWGQVGPGQSSRRHMHHERERWLIVAGHGLVSADGVSREVGPGDDIDLPPFVAHTIENPSPDQPLVFVALWWEDMALAAEQSRRDGAGSQQRATQRKATRYLITATPPTPNGDLHLGHLAGPYLGADICARALRMRGHEAHYITGSDDFQSYVASKALATEQPPEAVADHYAGRIQSALRRADIRCDQFTRTLPTSYVERTQAMIADLYQRGHVVAQEVDYLVSPDTGRCLFEPYVAGVCPHCAAPAGGGSCEECGRPNEGAALIDPVATAAATAAPLTSKRVTRLALPLAPHADRIRAALEQLAMPTHLRALAEQLLADGLPAVPVTHPHHWGLPCTVPGFEDQVISTWIEMGHSLLEGARACAQGGASPAPETTELVQFFGFDNGFYYALVYPLLHELAGLPYALPEAMVCNEFYLLDGQKFSTSRGHAIWVHEQLAMPTHLRALAEQLLADGLPAVPVTHPHHWGLPCTVPGFEDQVISTWIEMGHSLLEGARACAQGGASPAPETTELVQFFGFDNGFYYALVYPLLHELAGLPYALPEAMVCNEFYLLDGQKFSTSRGHAIWVHELLEREPADHVRLYLAHTRPEHARESFTVGDYRDFVAGELRGQWRAWLADLGQRVRTHAGGAAPAPGLWTATQRRYYAQLDALAEQARAGYEVTEFSPRQTTRALIELVRRARDFASGERHWASLPARRDEHRTALALELASARALALCVAPIMPSFAQTLWGALGLPGEVAAGALDAPAGWVPEGAAVTLDEVYAADAADADDDADANVPAASAEIRG